ncbi:MAG: hypothetical protein J6U54_19050 [Clostridiales bacterium]|nr:hypothetical protein [Clostridiales bacterium]
MSIYYVFGLPYTGELYHYISGGTTFGRMDSNELWHYGIKGQSWGKRRFQNEDGSLTFAGRNRYDVGPAVGTGSATITPSKAMPINKTSFASSNVGKSGSYSTGVSKPTATTSSAPKTTRTEIVRSKANAGRIAADNFLRNVSQGAGNIKSGVTQAATNAYNNVGGAVTNAGNWVDARANEVGDAVSNAAQNIGRTATNALDDTKGALKNVGNWLGDRAQNVGQAATNAFNDTKEAASNAGNWIGDRARDVGGAVSNAAQNVSDWYTGGNNAAKAELLNWQAQESKNRSDEYLKRANDISDKIATDVLDSGDRDNGMHGEIRDRAREDLNNKWYDTARTQHDLFNKSLDLSSQANSYQNEYNNAPRQRISNAAKNVSDAVYDAAQNVGQAATNAFNDTKEAASNAGNWIGDRARDVGGAVSNATQNVGQAASNAGNWVGDRARDVGAAVSNAAQNANNWLNGLNNPQIDSDRLMNAYREHINSLPPDNIMSPQHGQWLTDQVRNDPQVRALYDQLKNNNSNNSSQSSDNIMSDKPAGVSDEYWRDYKYNGGTRADWNKKQQSYMNSAGSSSKAATSSPVGTVDTSRPYHFTYDPNSGKTIVVYDDEKR